MTKVVIKSEKLTSFGRIFTIMARFFHLNSYINKKAVENKEKSEYK